MPRADDDLLKKQLDLEAHNVKYREVLDELRRKAEIRFKQSQESQTKRQAKRDMKTREATAKVTEHQKQDDRGHSHKQIDLFSALMDMAPRLEALTQSVGGRSHAFLGRKAREFDQVLGGMAGYKPGEGLWSSPSHMTDKLQYDLLQLFAKKEPIDIPDLKYLAGVDDTTGCLTMAWDKIPGFKGADGVTDLHEDPAFQRSIQDAITAWIETLDGPDGGYFVGPDQRLYPKSVGTLLAVDLGGGWVTNKDKLLDYYDEAALEQRNGVWVPKDGALLKEDKDAPPYLDHEAFEALRDNTDPDKSLQHFLDAYAPFEHVTMEHRPGLKP